MKNQSNQARTNSASNPALLQPLPDAEFTEPFPLVELDLAVSKVRTFITLNAELMEKRIKLCEGGTYTAELASGFWGLSNNVMGDLEAAFKAATEWNSARIASLRKQRPSKN